MHKFIHFLKDWKNQSKYMMWLIRYSKPYIPRILFLLILDVATSLIGVWMAIISKDIIDSATSGGIVKQAVFYYIIAIFASLLISAMTGLISIVVNEKFTFGIRKQVYEKIIRSHWMDVMKYHTGDLLTRLTSDAGNVADGIVNIIPTIIRLVVELLVTFFTLFYYQPMLAVFAMVMAPIVAVICFVLGRKLKSLQLKVQESESNYRSFIQESLSNLLVVKSFTNEEYVTDRLVQLRNERFYWVFKKNRVNIASSTLMTLSFNLGYIGAFVFGAFQLSKNAITYGMMSIFLTLVNRIQVPVMSLAQYVPKIVSILASAERIMELQNINLEEKSSEHITASNIGIDISDLTFGYTEEAVLDNVSVSIKPGEIVAIVGRSGIGKTTLIRLIMSFMSNVEGNIVFQNEYGERESANAGTREFIAYVPQGNTLFSGSIRENVRMGRLDATEDEIVAALKMAAGYEFVCNLPKGLDTEIGERGHGLSEGQAQRIAIARAFIRKAPFLILDEATSSLDEKTELSVLKGIQ
ncbi:MAG TPA: ABC transporter ATP-binding protein, partial [Mobilitalea sp.]|nr:ABC transporter ATP-binding protein [Mobilitalea sp.]